MLAYCGRPSSASFCDRFPYIGPRYARETIAETCSMRVALATAIISQTGSKRNSNATRLERRARSSLGKAPSRVGADHCWPAPL
jgi:hypothetical protein